MRQLGHSLLAIALLFALSAAAQETAPLTENEKAEIVQLARALEQNPLDPALVPARERLLKRIIEAPDITVTICSTPVSKISDQVKPKQLGAAVFLQQLLGAAAFLIEHPDRASDNVAQNVAGVESALKSYESLRRSNPKVKSKIAEELLARREAGQLDDHLRQAISCESNRAK